MMKSKTIHEYFELGLFLKGLNAIFEIIGGIIFSVLSLERINYIVYLFTQSELSEDPNDFIASHLVSFFKELPSSAQLYGSFYLISHGLIKLFLIYSLLKKKLWAYPLSIGVFVFFIIYQLFRYINTYSVMMLALSIFDTLVIFFIALEYKRIKNNF